MALTVARALLITAASGWLPVASLLAQSDALQRSQPSVDSITIRTTEGTALSFDLTPDGRTIIFDLLGQLWSIPVGGGSATPLTHTVRDEADDSSPSIAADGSQVVFHSDRPEGRGLWLQSLRDGTLRQLTDSTYFVNNEHVVPSLAPDGRRLAYLARWQLRVRDLTTNEEREIHPPGLPPFLSNLTWSPDGTHILVVAGVSPGRLWVVDPAANRAEPFDSARADVQAPEYSPDGSLIAYFSADTFPVVRLQVRRRGDGPGRTIVEGSDLSPLRVRWSPDAQWLFYSAGGVLWRVPAEGGGPAQIPFTATLNVPRVPHPRSTVPLPRPGETIRARGFYGLAIAPDARRYAIMALGQLWVAQVGGRPRPLRGVPSTAFGLSWSPDGSRMVWSAGRGGTEDLFVTEVRSGRTAQLTAIPGTEALASWSPDGKWIAFVHWAKPQSSLAPWSPDPGLRIRVVDAQRVGPAQLTDTQELGPFYTSAGSYHERFPDHARLNWNATSSAVLTFTAQGWPVANSDSAKVEWLGLDGSRRPLSPLLYRPSFTHMGRDGVLTYVEDALLWRRAQSSGEPQSLSSSPALYASVADDGTVLFASERGLRIHRPSGTEEDLGWPLPLKVAGAPPLLLIRNARIFDGSGASPERSSDILIANGRIQTISEPGQIRVRSGVTVLDAAERTVIPGLIDAHTHLPDASVPQAALYFGVTTIREAGSGLAWAAAQRDAVLAGAFPGARVVVSGPMIYPSPTTGGLTGDHTWMLRDSLATERGMALLRGFGVSHVKMRFPLTFASGTAFVRQARASGFTVSGHCAHPTSLAVAGVSGQEHVIGQCLTRGSAVRYDDLKQLYRAGGLWGVSTVSMPRMRDQAMRDSTRAAHDPEAEPFVTPWLRLMMLSTPPNEQVSVVRRRVRTQGLNGARWFDQAGLPLVLGVDAPEFPDGVHSELAELVAAGLTPSEALVAATSAAARAMGIDDIGRVEVGKVADLVLLDGNPVADIRDTRRIWKVIQGGRLVDRADLRSIAAQGR